VIFQDALVVLAGAGFDRSAGHLPALQPPGRVGTERDLFWWVVVGGVPAIPVDFATHRDRVGLGLEGRGEGVRAFVDCAVGSGVADAPAFRRKLFDAGE
jgi:hypothetical protein